MVGVLAKFARLLQRPELSTEVVAVVVVCIHVHLVIVGHARGQTCYGGVFDGQGVAWRLSELELDELGVALRIFGRLERTRMVRNLGGRVLLLGRVPAAGGVGDVAIGPGIEVVIVVVRVVAVALMVAEVVVGRSSACCSQSSSEYFHLITFSTLMGCLSALSHLLDSSLKLTVSAINGQIEIKFFN